VSLINDALKRAQAQKSQSDQTQMPHPLADLAEDPAPHVTPRRKKPRVFVLIAAVALAGGAVAAWQLLGGRAGGGTPSKASAAIARPAASPARAAQAAAHTTPLTPQATAEVAEIIAKSLAAIKYYRPPDVASDAGLQNELDADDPASDPDEPMASSPAAPAEKAHAPAPALAPPAAEVKPAPATQPAAAAPVQFDTSKYKVGGVLLDEENSSAVINGRLLRLGDSLDGAKIIKITSRSVQVEIAGQVFFLGT
jgi:hypothetical protein